MDFFTFAISLITIIGGFITLWMFILYQRREKKVKLSSDTEYDIRELSTMAKSLNSRIDTLESILDSEVPNWREQNDRHE